MLLSPKQREIIAYWNEVDPKITILEGAIRSGKTHLNNILFFRHIADFKDQRKHFIMTGYTISSLKRNVLDDFGKMFGIDTSLNRNNEFRVLGNTVNCFGTDDINAHRSIRGLTAHGWLSNETTLSHHTAIEEAFKRCSGDGCRIFMDTNPSYPKHPIKVKYIDRSGEKLSNGREHIKSWHFILDDNPFLSPEFVEGIKRTTPPGVEYERDIEGKWTAATGLVYPGLREAHFIDPFKIPKDWKRYRGIDWGFTNPFVCLWAAVDHDGRVYIYDEHYQTNMLIKDHAAIIKSKNEPGIYYRTVADHDPQDNAEIRVHGIFTNNAQKAVSRGIQKVAESLVFQQDGKARLYIFKTSKNTKREMEGYSWAPGREDKNEPEEPLKLDDHTPDVVRYIMMEIRNEPIVMG